MRLLHLHVAGRDEVEVLRLRVGLLAEERELATRVVWNDALVERLTSR